MFDSRLNSHFCTFLSTLTVLLAVIQQRSCANEIDDFAIAKKNNSLTSWQAFLEKHPSGSKQAEARRAFDSLLLKEAETNLKDPKKLKSFFERARTVEIGDKLFAMWDEAQWNEASQIDTDVSLREYLSKFPHGAHAVQAKSALEDVVKRGVEIAEELVWKSAQETGDRAAYEDYLKRYGRGRFVNSAREALAKLSYESARERDTVEAYEEFFRRSVGIDAKTRQSAENRLRQLMYERAVNSDALKDWISFADKYRYAKPLDDRNEFEQMKTRATAAVERLLYEQIVVSPTLELCQDYLKRYPEGGHKQQVIAKAEPLLFRWAAKTKTIDAYEKYLKEYPQGEYATETLHALEPVLFEKAKRDDWYSSFEEYIKRFPDGKNITSAKERLEWLKGQKAVVEVEFPKAIESGSAYWTWKIVFKETSGKIGYRVTGSGYTITKDGKRYGPNGFASHFKELEVGAGATKNSTSWVRGEIFSNGSEVIDWTGEDAGGHRISIRVDIKLKPEDRSKGTEDKKEK